MKTKSDISQHPVALAVLPLKEEAIARAGVRAKEQIEAVTAVLVSADWNLDTVAPKGDSFKEGRATYRTKEAKRNFFSRLTVTDEARAKAYAAANGLQRFNYNRIPHFVKADATAEARYIAECRAGAALDYDAFVYKLCEKVGHCTAAAIDGSHVWSESTLTVEKGNAVERWLTKTILNQSVYGKLFNQWPSRKLKSA